MRREKVGRGEREGTGEIRDDEQGGRAKKGEVSREEWAREREGRA